jgi:hypothetical protein
MPSREKINGDAVVSFDSPGHGKANVNVQLLRHICGEITNNGRPGRVDILALHPIIDLIPGRLQILAERDRHSHASGNIM